MADNSKCTVCIRSAEQNLEVNPEVHTNAFYAELFDVSEASVRRHYKHGPEPRIGFKTSSASDSDPDSERFAETTEESSTGARTVTAIRDRPITLEDARAWIRASGDDPAEFNYSARSVAYGRDLFSNKMSAWPKFKKYEVVDPDSTLDIDPIQILSDLRSSFGEPVQTHVTGDGAFVLSFNDTQFGKDEGGGTLATIARVEKYVAMAKDRIAELRRNGRLIGTLVIVGGGDIVEGTCIYPNQSYNIDMPRREQIKTAVTMILFTLDSLAGLFENVVVLATRGNHGENRIGGNRTTLADNDDLLVFEMAQEAADRDENLQHIDWIIANDEPGVYADVAGWRIATTHGDIYGKGVQGPTNDKKAQAWYKNMAMARNPIGRADVLITHHFHHDKMSDWGACIWRQTPAMDGGSAWFEQTSGEYSPAGMLTFVMTPNSRYQDEQVLR